MAACVGWRARALRTRVPASQHPAPLPPLAPQLRAKLAQLKLNDGDVWAREAARKARGEGVVDGPWWIKAPFWALCVVLDLVFANRPIPVGAGGGGARGALPLPPPSPPCGGPCGQRGWGCAAEARGQPR